MDIDDVVREFQEVRKEISEGGGFGFASARELVKLARDELRRNNVSGAFNLLKKAKKDVLTEKQIASEINRLVVPQGYKAWSIKEEIVDMVRSGDFESARSRIRELKNAVEEERKLFPELSHLESLINKKLPGSNIQEAVRLKSEAQAEMIAGNYQKAGELIESAKLAAKPTPDYLLSKARNLAEKAEELLSRKEYEGSIEKWKESIEEYGRAREAAMERGDETLARKIDEAIKILEENIEKAKIAIDKRDMGKLILNAREIVKNAHNLFDDQKYDEAKELYEKALSSYSKALELAKKRDFDEKDEIQKAMDNLRSSIESCLIAKGELLIRKAESELESAGTKEEAERIEKEFRKVLNYLNSIDVEDKNSLEVLKKRASEGLIESMILQAEMEMKRAEELFTQKEYYDAKELYSKIWNYLNRLLDESTSLQTSYKKEYIDRLIEACNQNVTRATDILTGVRRVDIELVRVDDVIIDGRKVKVRGDENKKRITHPIEEFLTEYDKLEYIGGGGFADIFKVEKDGKVFAIKVPRDLKDEKQEEIFFNEVKKWEELKHRNIVNLIKPRVRPRAHLVLEYVDGTSLDKLIGRLSIEEACRIAFDIARALEYAHSKHIIHCDLKPKNILVTGFGEAKVTDFGLATGLGSSLKGLTPAYAAPETVKGEIPDERTDVYQLGLIFYEMITGVNPFAEGDGNLRNRIADLVPDPPSKFRPEVEPLDDLIMRCLSKNPEERPSIREFRETVYEYMKKYHNVSLHLTKDYETMARKAIRLAFYAVKQNDLKTALAEMEFAMGKVRADLREEIESIANRMEYMVREGIGITDELVEMVEGVLKRVG